MTVVNRYGVHWQDDIAYLHQGNGSNSNVTALGVKGRSPFKVRSSLPCWTRLDPTKPAKLVIDPTDPFVKAMDPVPAPDGENFSVDKEHLEQLRWLSWMSGTSLMGQELPREFMKTPPGHLKFTREAWATNVQPLIITGLTSADIGFALRVTQGLWPRKIIFVGDSDVFIPGMKKVAPAFDYRVFRKDEWVGHGNWLIREYMLNGSPTSY